MFTHIQDCIAVLVSKGVYRQVDCYVYDKGLYAKVGGGYIRLYDGQQTSHEKWRLHDIQYPDGKKPEVGEYNRLCWPHKVARTKL